VILIATLICSYVEGPWPDMLQSANWLLFKDGMIDLNVALKVALQCEDGVEI
jgi:hypothetical protein